MAKNVQVLEPVITLNYNNDGEEIINKRRVCAYCRVSTDSEEQMKSYDAQVSEYTKKIKENSEWEFIQIYTDAGISGTNVKNRLGFNRMIKDCKDGKVDLILTKSISRFARNTVDCLNNVRMLRNIGVEVFFEKENIYSFDPKVELVLTMMSSIAQEESRSISENSKWGIKKRFKDGVTICNTTRLHGYDKDEKGNLVINKEEAKIIKRIYKEYLEGSGYSTIAKGLEADGIKTVTGGTTWHGSTISKILSNEKYYGVLLLQKTVTVDYLSHKRVKNKNLEPMYKIENNHEPIISKEIFDAVQEEKKKRFEISSGKNKDRTKYTNKYAFSGKLFCDKCGRTLKRRTWNSGTPSEKIMWQCNNYIKGIENCSAKAVSDEVLKRTFVQLYNDMVEDKSSFFKTFMANIEKVLEKDISVNKINDIIGQIGIFEQDLKNLIQLQLRGKIDEKYYDEEYQRIKGEIDKLNDEKINLEEENLKDSDYKQRLKNISKILNENGEGMKEFDEDIFIALVNKVIIKSPEHFVFVLENGIEFERQAYCSSQHSGHLECVVRLERKHI